MSKLSYSIIIATYERPEPLRRALESLTLQSRPPERVIVVDSSTSDTTRSVVESFAPSQPVEYLRSAVASSAQQRNVGIDRCISPLVVFMDDDAVLYAYTMERLLAAFTQEGGHLGGVSARMEGFSHPRPSRWLWWYYRLQAGYRHATYGGKLFGPAINCVPCYDGESRELIPADWLSTCCVMYRAELVKRERFPDFQGYSHMEDVHLSARIARTHALAYHASAWFRHEDASSGYKTARREMVRHRFQNQRRVAREVMGKSGFGLACQFFLHRLVTSAALLRQRSPGWVEELIGVWT